jgi:hypothetical protein
MDEPDLERLRTDLRSDVSVVVCCAIGTAMTHAERTVSLIPDIYALTRHPDEPVARTAWWGISYYERAAVPFLLQLMRSEHSRDRVAAITTLSSLGRSRSAFSCFYWALKERPSRPPDWGDWREEVLASLRSALKDDDKDVRSWAAMTLDDVDEHSEVIKRAIAVGLESADGWVRQLSAAHLGRLGEEAWFALPALGRCVELPEPTDQIGCRPALTAEGAIKAINATHSRR